MTASDGNAAGGGSGSLGRELNSVRAIKNPAIKAATITHGAKRMPLAGVGA
jgi:hypothetical protein